MKIYVKSATESYTYRGFKIYYDGREWYIYRSTKGTGRMEFATDAEAEEWIDDYIAEYEA